jgi:hypothetical protein
MRFLLDTGILLRLVDRQHPWHGDVETAVAKRPETREQTR